MFNYLYKKLIRPIFLIRSSHHSIALGVALGMFITLTPTVGVQMLLIFVIGTLIKANRIVALILCWISNPLTVLPLYYAYYFLGGKLLGLELWTIGNFSKKLEVFRVALEELAMSKTIELFWDGIIWPMWLGSLIIATVVSVPCYPLTRYALRRQREMRSARWKERRALLEARRHEQKKGTLPRSKVILFALLSTILHLFTSCGEPGGGESAPAPSRMFGEGFAVAHGELETGCSFFLEFSGLKDDDLNFACLRIYNFLERPGVAEGVERAFHIVTPGGRRPLRPLKDLGRRDLSGVLGLLPLGSPGEEVPPFSWTRIILAYDGRPFTASEGRVLYEPPADDAGRTPGIRKTFGGTGRREASKEKSPTPVDEPSWSLEFLDVSRSAWAGFVRNPTEDGMVSIVNG